MPLPLHRRPIILHNPELRVNSACPSSYRMRFEANAPHPRFPARVIHMLYRHGAGGAAIALLSCYFNWRLRSRQNHSFLVPFHFRATQTHQPRSGGSSLKEHHHTTSFEEAYINILRRHEIEFDRKYLFETEHHG